MCVFSLCVAIDPLIYSIFDMRNHCGWIFLFLEKFSIKIKAFIDCPFQQKNKKVRNLLSLQIQLPVFSFILHLPPSFHPFEPYNVSIDRGVLIISFLYLSPRRLILFLTTVEAISV